MTFKKLIFCALFSSFAFVSHANAQQPQKDTLNGFVAGGFFLIPDYEGSSDYQAVPLAAARINYNQYYFQTRGLGAIANISPFEQIEFGPAFAFNMGRDDDVDDNRVARLREIDTAFEAGFFVKLPFNNVLKQRDELAFSIDYLTDISDEHDGTQISFGPSYGYSPAPKWYLTSSLNMTYADDNYMDSFFSIDANNAARSGLRQYTAEAGIKDVGLSLMANYQLSGRWGLMGLIGYKQLLGDAADGPIPETGSESQFSGGLGISYRF